MHWHVQPRVTDNVPERCRATRFSNRTVPAKFISYLLQGTQPVIRVVIVLGELDQIPMDYCYTMWLRWFWMCLYASKHQEMSYSIHSHAFSFITV